jgi:hypothetical protein
MVSPLIQVPLLKGCPIRKARDQRPKYPFLRETTAGVKVPTPPGSQDDGTATGRARRRGVKDCFKDAGADPYFR